MQSFAQNKKPLSSEPKISYLGIFRLKFEKKTIVMVDISIFILAEMQSLIQHKKKLEI